MIYELSVLSEMCFCNVQDRLHWVFKPGSAPRKQTFQKGKKLLKPLAPSRTTTAPTHHKTYDLA